MHDDVAELRSKLDAIADELGDLAHSSLRDALRSNAQDAAARERRFTRARRAVIKAATILAHSSGDADDELD